MKKNRNSVYLIFGILLFSNILAWLWVYDLNNPAFLRVIFFDVGQGESILLVSPKGHQVLIDGGPDSRILEKLAKEISFWDNSLDLIVLTHPSSDHLNGLIAVLERYQIKNILWTGIIVDSSVYEEWQKAIKKEGAEIFIAQANQRVRMGKKTYLDILNPLKNIEGQEIKNSKEINNSSIVARLVHLQNSFLFTADIEKPVEQKLLERKALLNSDILKIAHHGSRTSSSEEFLKSVLPKMAVISVGKNNRHGHPHQETLETLVKYDITILRTDRDGDIKIISDGNNYRIIR